MTVTVPTIAMAPAPTMSAADQAALKARCLTVFAAGLHHADPQELDHEAARIEALPDSPVADRMRQLLTLERRKRLTYRCVLIFTYTSGPQYVANQPVTRQQALQQWRYLVATGAYGPHTHRRALVMADADYLKLPGAGR